METPGPTCYRALVSRFHRRSASGAAVLVAIACAGSAHADVSSWLFAGGGPSAIDQSGSSRDVTPSLELAAGLGLPPSYDVVPGFLFRTNTRFGNGTDLAMLLRTASGGYVRGNWGLAVDLGGYERFWGEQPAPGFAGSLSLGAPWGIALNLDFQQSSNSVRTFAAVLGLDLARFTIYRSTGLDWWSNPYPSPPTRER